MHIPKLLVAALLISAGFAQQDPLESAHTGIAKATHNNFDFTFEERTRWEERYGVNFGSAVNQQDMLSRIRIGMWWQPAGWVRVYAMGQDTRAPFFGVRASNSLRDTIDLQESYLEFGRKSGAGALIGRQMIDLGESRLIGTPQWSNVARTYDTARFYYRTGHARLEALLVSPVKVRPDDFNNPELGEHIWGTYDTFTGVVQGASVDAYALRHSQNKIGGWTGAGTLGTNTFGGRFYGPLPHKLAFSLEGVGQTGHLGAVTQRAFAWFASISRPVSLAGKPLTLEIEYKGASGTKAGSRNGGTYDQLSPANHDKFGHLDLFGWRNLKTLRSLDTWALSKSFAWNFMYTDHWLYSATDSLYDSRGNAISTSRQGTAGTHVGQEFDTFVTWRHGPHLLGAGFGHFFRGEFVAAATAHINPRYFYIFQQYSLGKPR